MRGRGRRRDVLHLSRGCSPEWRCRPRAVETVIHVLKLGPAREKATLLAATGKTVFIYLQRGGDFWVTQVTPEKVSAWVTDRLISDVSKGSNPPRADDPRPSCARRAALLHLVAHVHDNVIDCSLRRAPAGASARQSPGISSGGNAMRPPATPLAESAPCAIASGPQPAGAAQAAAARSGFGRRQGWLCHLNHEMRESELRRVSLRRRSPDHRLIGSVRGQRIAAGTNAGHDFPTGRRGDGAAARCRDGSAGP